MDWANRVCKQSLKHPNPVSYEVLLTTNRKGKKQVDTIVFLTFTDKVKEEELEG
jgi:hypothetical protein